MKVRVRNGLKILLEEKRKYLEELEEYNSMLEKNTPEYKVELREEVRRIGKVGRAYFIRFKGLIWKAPKGKGKFRREGFPVEISNRVPVPPRFAFEKLEGIIDNSDLILEYSMYRRFKEYFKGLEVEALEVDLKSILKTLCDKSVEYAKYLENIVGFRVEWVPLTKILDDVTAEARISSKELIEAIMLSEDLRIARLELGDGGELWFNIKSSCVD